MGEAVSNLCELAIVEASLRCRSCLQASVKRFATNLQAGSPGVIDRFVSSGAPRRMKFECSSCGNRSAAIVHLKAKP